MVAAEAELKPKVDALPALVREQYGYYLAGRGLMFDGDTVVIDPSNGTNYQPTASNPPGEDDRLTLADEQRAWEGIKDDLRYVMTRFEQYYPLDPMDLTMIGMRLGGSIDAGDEVGGSVVADTAPHTAVGQITYADDHWMQRVDTMIDGGAENTDGGDANGFENGQGEWSGDAANAFNIAFLEPFHTAAGQQAAYVFELNVAVRLYHDTAREAITTANRILDTSHDVLTNKGSGSVDWLGVAGIVAGVLGFSATGVGTAANIIGLGIGIYSLLQGEAEGGGERETVEIHGHNPWMFIESIVAALDQYENETVARVDAGLNSALSIALDSPEAFDSSGLRLDRPELADLDDPSAGFGTLNIPSGGVPVERSQVVASVVDVYAAGFVNLPGAATEYAGASQKVTQAALPGYLTWFFQLSPIRYDQARYRLIAILDSTRRSLTDAGAALVEVANSYVLTDAEAQERVSRVEEIHPPASRTEPPVVDGQVLVIN